MKLQRLRGVVLAFALAACASPARPPQTLPDACAAKPEPHAKRVAIFLAEFVATKDEPAIGAAHALRLYMFRPVASWRGVASADPIALAAIAPNDDDTYALPRFTVGERVFVVMDTDGESGTAPMMSNETVTAARAEARMQGLGAPCWKRPL